MFGLGVYTYNYLIARTDLPYLSLADVFYLLSYPPIILGCVGLLRLFGRSLGRLGWLAVAGVGVVLYGLVVVYAIVPSIQYLDTLLEVLVTALYPSLDIVIFLLVLPLFYAFRKGIFESSFALIALGAFLFALGDLVFTYVNLSEGYYDGHPLDLLWFIGSISSGYGFYRQQADLKSIE